MKHPKLLPLSLVLVLLFSSSFASGLMAHGHGADSASLDSVVAKSMHEHASHSQDHTTLGNNASDQPDSGIESNHSCLCDELCSTSSLHSAASHRNLNAIPLDLHSLFLERFYQSISLNLPVPPPTS
ncbi:MAG: hypothetical protein AB8B95_06190 [Pseudohongiellaceae bacterium]